MAAQVLRPSSQPLGGASTSRRPARSAVRVAAASTGLAPPTQRQRLSGATQPTGAPTSGAVIAAPRTGTQLIPWFSRPAQTPEAPVEVKQATAAQQPILSFAGGGIFFWWELGVLRYLHRNFDLTKVQLVGASAGGLISTLAACGVDEDKAMRVAYRIAGENGVFDRPGGLAGIWGTLIRQWLDELLPEDAAERCRGRVRLIVTEVPSLKLRYLEDFTSKQDLIDANMTSVHIPFFLDGNASHTYRGQSYIDGSLWDFVMSDNSDLIKCPGQPCTVIDYFNDDQLKWNRLDFLKLADLEQIQAFVETGYTYAERTDASTDWFQSAMGEVRKGAVRQLLEVPLWAARRTLASVDG